MAEGERIPLNEDSLVGRAMLLNEPQTGPVDVRLPSYGKVRRPSLALPLQAGGRIFGGVLLLAEVGRAFDPQTIDLLRLVIDQLASALENARLFEQSVANVAEIEALNRRLTREAWEEYIGDGESLRHTLDPQSQWPDDLEALRERAELVIETYEDSNGRSVLAAPLVSRGEPIGTLAVTRPAGETWTRDERLLFEAVASRLALMAENIRIVEEASLRAEHERRVNEVSAGLMQRTESVEGVLQAALNQLSSVLGSEHVSLRIGRPPGTDSSVAQGDGSGDSFPGNGG
jgi:GAF domain-containing protein